ncbi:MAG: hypothetical protein DSZ03_02095 [Sulfurimonas sp.]|nr:MAG: hypothetical protein DSZ03_02095 [Sulfurimonas sp.]
MIRALLLFSLLLCRTGSADEWTPVKSVSLAKDQLERIVVKNAALKRMFEFRWTLYANDTLVVLRSYDDVVAQHVLRKEHKNKSFRVILFSEGGRHRMPPYLIVTFRYFDFKTKQALFDIYLSDDDERVALKFLQETI